MKKQIIMAFITVGAFYAALFGKKVYDASKEAERDRVLRNWEDEQHALGQYREDLDSGYYDRDPRDYL